MIDTNRITSDYDIELLLGKGWLLTALQSLSENDLIELPLNITIDDVNIIDDPDWDLEIRTSINLTINASIVLENRQLVFSNSFNDDTFEIEIPRLGALAGDPVLQKVIGDDVHENALALLINLDIRASGQDVEPLANTEHLERGNPDNSQSFLPTGQHIALGMARNTFKRFANNIWHTQLRDGDGSHPLPRPGDDKKGDWKKVALSMTQNRIKYTLEGEVPIDFWPDADVDLSIKLRPVLENGKLNFAIDTDLDIDTGFWGDLLAFSIGALLGFLITVISGGVLLVPIIASGFGAVILLEVGEYVVGEVLERIILAKDGNGTVLSSLMCDESVVKLAFPKPSEDGFSIGMLDAVPTSIPVFADEEDPLFTRFLNVNANFNEINFNGNGLAIAGLSEASELFQPKPATITESAYNNNTLAELTYETSDTNEQVTLPLEVIFEHLELGKLNAPFTTSTIDDPLLSIPDGKLCCSCLVPTHIRREATIVKRIKFENGLELNTEDAVTLQDKAGIYLEGLQLIKPTNGNAYFRSPPNNTTDDNFESLPEF